MEAQELSEYVQGTLFRASQFLSEELPIRLAHRVQELGDLPDGLNDMPSIKKVQDWYSQSFEVWAIYVHPKKGAKADATAARISPNSPDRFSSLRYARGCYGQ